MFKVVIKLKLLKQHLKEWNKVHFNIFMKKKETEEGLEALNTKVIHKYGSRSILERGADEGVRRNFCKGWDLQEPKIKRDMDLGWGQELKILSYMHKAINKHQANY